MEVEMPDSDSQRIGRWLLVFTVLVSLSLAAAITVGRRTMRMSSAMTAAADPNAFTELAPGSKTQAVVEVSSLDKDGNAEGKLLDREREDLYRRTATPVSFKYTQSTPVVMGKLGDLHPGAVVHVKGTVGVNHEIAAEQIVILTGYVKVN
jgi:hypothetical protein